MWTALLYTVNIVQYTLLAIEMRQYILHPVKQDGVGLADNRPSTD